MRPSLFTLLFSTLILGVLSTAACAHTVEEKDNSQTRAHTQYPCDVFSFAFCFRKPHNSVVTQRSGPDFEVYQVSAGETRPLFSIYVGTTPERVPENATRLHSFIRNDLDITINEVDESPDSKAIDIRVLYPNGLMIHVFGANTAIARDKLADALKGFHQCAKREFTSIDCHDAPLFDQRSVSAIRGEYRSEN